LTSTDTIAETGGSTVAGALEVMDNEDPVAFERVLRRSIAQVPRCRRGPVVGSDGITVGSLLLPDGFV